MKQKNVHRLERQVDESTDQLIRFDKEAEEKRIEVAELGKNSINAQMLKVAVESNERVLHDVADERERRRVKLKSKGRVKVLGDQNSPANVPESPD